MEDDDSMSMAAAAQKHEIAKLMNYTRLVKDDAWYLIDFQWMKRWKRFVGYDHWDTGIVGSPNAHPGPINNAYLLKDNLLTLRPDLREEIDFTLVPEEAWKKLVDFYTLPTDQKPIKRYVIEYGFISKQYKVEVYCLELKLCRDFNVNNAVTKSFSKMSTIESVVVSMRNIFGISKRQKVQLWFRYLSRGYDVVYKWTDTLQDASVYPGQLVVIQVPDNNGTFSMPVKTSRGANMSSVARSVPTSSRVKAISCKSSQSASGGNGIVQNNTNDTPKDSPPGLCGLSNLGNTCFMNAALQCLSNVPSLTEYMLSDRWRGELNRDSVLGHDGKIAEAYSNLIRTIWSGTESSIFPRDFKATIGKYNPEFSGFLQQDAHEFLAFLLDGLHEDLNRIKVKSNAVEKRANNRPDEEVATEAWVDYIRRNDSVIIDTFHGLLKSTVACLECGKVSVKFDPFGYLSLPLPVKRKERQIKLTLVRYDPMCKLRQFRVKVLPTGFIADLCLGVSKLTDVVIDNLIVVEICNHHFRRFFKPEDSVSDIEDHNEVYIYEVPDNENGAMINIPIEMNEVKPVVGAKSISKVLYNRRIPIMLQLKSQGVFDQAPAPEMRSFPTNLFGLPMIVAVPKDNCTYQLLYNTILNKTTRYVGFMDLNSGSWTPFQNIEVDATVQEEMDVDEGDKANNNNSKSESYEVMEDKDFYDSSPHTESEQLFTLQAVNSYGSDELGKIKDDEGPIQFPDCPSYIANWDSELKSIVYDEHRALAWDSDASVYTKVTETPNQINLTDCLDLFTSRECLGDNDLGFARNPGVNDSGDWYCPACEKLQKATKKIDIWQLPRVLVIHLKRFAFSRSLKDKLDTFVRFPVGELNLQKWLINPEHKPAIYELLAVTNHMGGLGFGHYTAYTKNKNDKWYRFDDANVRLMSKDDVMSQDGYVLVYQMRSEAPSPPASMGDLPSLGNSETSSPLAAKEDQNSLDNSYYNAAAVEASDMED